MCLGRMILPLNVLLVIFTFANASVNPNGLRVIKNGRGLSDCNCKAITCTPYKYDGNGNSYKPKDVDEACWKLCCEGKSES